MSSEQVPSQFELETMGLIKHTRLPKELAWVTPEVRALLLLIAECKDEGFPLPRVEKFGQAALEVLIEIEVRGHADRIWDPRVKKHFLVLTWKGKELAELVERTLRNRKDSFSAPATTTEPPQDVECSS